MRVLYFLSVRSNSNPENLVKNPSPKILAGLAKQKALSLMAWREMISPTQQVVVNVYSIDEFETFANTRTLFFFK